MSDFKVVPVGWQHVVRKDGVQLHEHVYDSREEAVKAKARLELEEKTDAKRDA